MSKQSIVKQVLFLLKEELATVKQAAEEAHLTATHEESVAENKYDTFGLEAAYLAEGLSKRVGELTQAIHQYESANFPDLIDSPIRLGALVELENEQGDILHYFFIGPAGGGIQVETTMGNYKVITPASPIGERLLGKEIGDEVVLSLQGKRELYEIVAIR